MAARIDHLSVAERCLQFRKPPPVCDLALVHDPARVAEFAQQLRAGQLLTGIGDTSADAVLGEANNIIRRAAEQCFPRLAARKGRLWFSDAPWCLVDTWSTSSSDSVHAGRQPCFGPGLRAFVEGAALLPRFVLLVTALGSFSGLLACC